jgi:hypothetical protein
MDDARLDDLFYEVAERHRITTWELHQMIELMCFGPAAVDDQTFDPIEEIEYRAYHDRKRLEERPSIPELLSIWKGARDVCLSLAERQRDPTKRAAMFAKLAEREAEMKRLRERLAQTLPETLEAEFPDKISEQLAEQGRLAMQRFRGFGKAVRLEKRRAGRAS